MARHKKQYRPIAGQKWWEKVLDWVSRDESFRFSNLLLIAYATLLLIPAYMISNTTNRLDAAEIFMSFWFRGLVPVGILAMLNPCCSDWGLRLERKLKQPIKDHITQHGPCTYNELITLFMPFKIHLGIDDALETLVNSRNLVCAGDLYRLPSPEDRKQWFDEWFEAYSKEYTFGLLEDIFALDLKRFDCGITIQFYTQTGANFWIIKEEEETSGQVYYQVISPQDNIMTFKTFQELAAAPIFDGQSLREVWSERVVLTYINDEDIDWWIEIHLH